MQIVSKKLSTSGAAMAVKNREKRDFLLCFRCFGRSVVVLHVQDNGNAVFVVRPNEAVVGVGCVRPDDPKRLD